MSWKASCNPGATVPAWRYFCASTMWMFFLVSDEKKVGCMNCIYHEQRGAKAIVPEDLWILLSTDTYSRWKMRQTILLLAISFLITLSLNWVFVICMGGTRVKTKEIRSKPSVLYVESFINEVHDHFFAVCLEIIKVGDVIIRLFIMAASFICNNLEALKLKISNYDAFRGNIHKRKVGGSL